MQEHVRILAIIWLIYSILHLLPALGMTFYGWMGFPFLHHMPRGFFVGPLIATAGGIFILVSILGILAGWGLLERRTWARMFAIVLACLALFNIPFGTALGIYTLWVLLPAESEREYVRLAGSP